MNAIPSISDIVCLEFLLTKMRRMYESTTLLINKEEMWEYILGQSVRSKNTDPNDLSDFSFQIWIRSYSIYIPLHMIIICSIDTDIVFSLHICQWRGALMFSLICGSTNGWANNRDAANLRRHRSHYDVTVMTLRGKWDLCILFNPLQKATFLFFYLFRDDFVSEVLNIAVILSKLFALLTRSFVFHSIPGFLFSTILLRFPWFRLQEWLIGHGSISGPVSIVSFPTSYAWYLRLCDVRHFHIRQICVYLYVYVSLLRWPLAYALPGV